VEISSARKGLENVLPIERSREGEHGGMPNYRILTMLAIYLQIKRSRSETRVWFVASHQRGQAEEGASIQTKLAR